MAEHQNDGPSGKEGVTGTDDGKDGLIDRRSYLKLSGAAAASTVVAGVGSASETVHGIGFDRVVNIVDDYGADPNGNEPIDSALDSAISDGTLVQFPEGRYQFGSVDKVLTGMQSIGFQGLGDVKWVPPTGAPGDKPIFNVGGRSNSVNHFLLEDIDIDIRADNTTAGFKLLVQDGFHVENVEFIGRGDSNDYQEGGGPNIVDCFITRIASSSGEGVLKNVVAKKGSHWARYGGGRAPIWAGPGFKGTLKVIDCHFEEFGGSGIYATAIPGKIQIEGGVFRNNNGQAMRFGGDGSYVDGALIEIDASKYSGKRESQYEDRAFKHRGIVINQKSDYIDKAPGAEIRNCDIVINNHPNPGPAITARGPAKTVNVKNTRIQVNANVPAVLRVGQKDFGHHPASGTPRWLRMENVSITGDAAGGNAVVAHDAPNSVIKNCCIQQTGSSRSGVKLNNADGSRVEDSTINVSGDAVDFQSSSVETTNVERSGTCPVPSAEGDSGNGSETDDSTNTEDSTDQPQADYEVRIAGKGTATNYEFTASDGLRAADNSLETWDTISGTSASGWVTDSTNEDAFAVVGKVTEFTFVEGDADVYVDGQLVDDPVAATGSSDSTDGSGGSTDDTSDSTNDTSDSTDDTSQDQTTQRELRIVGKGTATNYEFTVSDTLESADGTLETWDAIDGTTASGWVTDSTNEDAFAFVGEITEFAFVEGDADVYVDGQLVDDPVVATQSTDGSGDSTDDTSSQPTEYELRIVGKGTSTNYEFTTSEDLQVANDSLETWDTIDGTTASGWVTESSHEDAFTVVGEVTEFAFVEGDADVYVDGQLVDDPVVATQSDTSDGSTGDTSLPNTIVIDNSTVSGQSTYSFGVSGDIEKDSSAGSVEDDDVVSGSTVEGQVEGDKDAYRFSGDITTFNLDGSAAVYFEEDNA
ncbi:hypothetical protein G9464_19655 [Halostella sp. JP-L12]|uniref:twin-arginine translocation signal domain-containing protein n=1 Tax=Halostella TaxID=1843185 RepID=UPI000EF75F39|nr:MULTISPECIES: twin-arginine translocation signal domain-containing protein [Halostella]NHN49789.1 hypothetical protein [Halostella sp. JP-L12]